MHKKYPNSKFVFIEFPEAQLCIPDFREEYAKLASEQIKRIEEMGIIYINASELAGHKFCGKKYRVADNDHPSETTWDELIPPIAKKLKL